MNDKPKHKRIMKPELRRISTLMSAEEHEIVKTINRVRFITANQLQRIYFTSSDKPSTNLRTCNRMVNKLKDYGLIAPLQQRVGGIRRGSGSTIWAVSSAGFQYLRLDNLSSIKTDYKRMYEPNILFLEHTLAVTEIYTRLVELDRQKRIELLEVQHEPRCWRTFSLKVKGTKTATYLKPDLFTRLSLNDEYEESYLIECDRATEAPCRIIRKCRLYVSYHNSGIEQRQNQIFPYVVWITINEKRREQLIQHIRKYLPKAEMLFQVITIDEFETLIVGDQSKEDEQHDL